MRHIAGKPEYIHLHSRFATTSSLESPETVSSCRSATPSLDSKVRNLRMAVAELFKIRRDILQDLNASPEKREMEFEEKNSVSPWVSRVDLFTILPLSQSKVKNDSRRHRLQLR